MMMDSLSRFNSSNEGRPLRCDMSEARLLSIVARYPHSRALARRVPGSAFVLLRRLEARGLVSRRQGLYRLTRRGRQELDTARAVAILMVRATGPSGGRSTCVCARS